MLLDEKCKKWKIKSVGAVKWNGKFKYQQVQEISIASIK